MAEILRSALLGDDRYATEVCSDLIAGALRSDATVRPVDLGPGLVAVVRTSADTTARVLCVHNVTDEPAVFQPAAAVVGSLTFVRGQVDTDDLGTGVLRCRLCANGFVWFGILDQAK
ncbi:hypothetical protein [Actinokineospora sp.]|uniref:hypothetical protein n=1 Tax=Actinokineospora sp. TaxID=1872133 RepID=UPI004037EB39